MTGTPAPRRPRRATLAALVVVALVVAACTAPTSADNSGPPAAPPTAADTIGHATTSPTAPPPTGVAAPPSPSPRRTVAPGARYVFPVSGRFAYARSHHDYPATDIITACGRPVRAVTDGVVLAVSRTDRFDPTVNAGASRGGLSVSILGDDGVRYYGSHLATIAAAVTVGHRVTAGHQIGTIGRTGDTTVCHLHFGISPPCARTGDWYNQRGLIWPWPYLDSWRAGGQKSPVAQVTAWHRAHGCPRRAVTDP